MFSFPYSAQNLTGALSSISGEYSKVQTYNATLGGWQTYDTSVNQSFDTLTTLDQGYSYWIFANQNATLVIN
jgi:hypothetical protein